MAYCDWRVWTATITRSRIVVVSGLFVLVACGGSARVEVGDSANAGQRGALAGAPAVGGMAGALAGAPGAGGGGGGAASAGAPASGSGGAASTGAIGGAEPMALAGAGGDSGDSGDPGACISSDGRRYKEGEQFEEACNTCRCEANGAALCTQVACQGCTYQGKRYGSGDVFPDRDGCNTCTCQGRGVSCTKEAHCACQPEREWWLHYVVMGQPCQAENFACPSLTTPFVNACGCGCESQAVCTEFVSCTPSAPKPCFNSNCPYSKPAP